MKKLKIVFFGTPEFAAYILNEINNSKHQVIAVVTAPDKKSGRGLKIHESAVKQVATKLNIETFQPEKLRNESFLNQIEGLNADVFIVIAFRMMPKVLFTIPKLGTFNLHASLLPHYRGAAPINFALINGEKVTGVTTFFINEKIDEGNILLQDQLEIDEEDNAGSLHDKLMILGAKTVLKTLNNLADNCLSERPQEIIENPKTAYKIFKNDTYINWQMLPSKINDFVRGMSPYPCAITKIFIDGDLLFLKIYAITTEEIDHNRNFKEIEMSKSEFKIYLKNSIIYLKEVQLEGKKRMLIKDFINGLNPNSKFELE